MSAAIATSSKLTRRRDRLPARTAAWYKGEQTSREELQKLVDAMRPTRGSCRRRATTRRTSALSDADRRAVLHMSVSLKSVADEAAKKKQQAE